MAELVKAYIETRKGESEKLYRKETVRDRKRDSILAGLTKLDEREQREVRAHQILEVDQIRDVPKSLESSGFDSMTMARNEFGAYIGTVDGISVEFLGYRHPSCVKCNEWIEVGQLFLKEPQLTSAGRKILRHVNCS